MCRVGDIILIKNYKHGDKNLSRHSFVVVDDEDGEIHGLEYNFVCNVMSSFKDEKQRKRKLSYPGNFEVLNRDTITNPNDGKDGFIKAEQLYYFNKNNIEYIVIGRVTEEFLEQLFDFINSYVDSGKNITLITDNLK